MTAAAHLDAGFLLSKDAGNCVFGIASTSVAALPEVTVCEQRKAAGRGYLWYRYGRCGGSDPEKHNFMPNEAAGCATQPWY